MVNVIAVRRDCAGLAAALVVWQMWLGWTGARGGAERRAGGE